MSSYIRSKQNKDSTWKNTLTNPINPSELQFPFPTSRLASTALDAIQVDPELSPLVRREFSLIKGQYTDNDNHDGPQVLRVDYRATTNRMLRVAVNSFMESLRLVVEVMEKLDVDVLDVKSDGVQKVK
jgi:EKC/KEOPS complex subunit PCC1/LAGE3